jgi:hypothetical protein
MRVRAVGEDSGNFAVDSSKSSLFNRVIDWITERHISTHEGVMDLTVGRGVQVTDLDSADDIVLTEDDSLEAQMIIMDEVPYSDEVVF